LCCGLEVGVKGATLFGKKLFDCSCICAEEVYLNCIECYLTSEKQRNVIVKDRNFKLVLKKQSTKEEAQGFE
jgi:hypothetical protein